EEYTYTRQDDEDERASRASARRGDQSEEDYDEQSVKALRNVVYGLAEKHFSQMSSSQNFESFKRDFDSILSIVINKSVAGSVAFDRFMFFTPIEREIMAKALNL